MMIVKFPTKIKIGPHVFSVRFSKDVITKRQKPKTENYGIITYDDLEIAVLPTGNSIEQESYLHEIMHGVFFATNLGTKISSKLEEEIIAAISPVLIDVLKSNPDTTKFLLGKDEL